MKNEPRSTKQAFGDALVKYSKDNKNIYALSADLRDSLGLSDFAKEFSDRFIECGVAEQNMVGIATGLASCNKIPFACSFAVFNPGRTWDQIRVGVCIGNLNVKIVGGYGGVSNFKDGASHQAFEDIAITRVLPNLKVIVPCDYNQTFSLVGEMLKDNSPTYLRLSSEKVQDITKPNQTLKIGEAQVLTKGDELLILSYGALLHRVLKAVERANIKATVINMPTINPLDTNILDEYLDKIKNVVVAEDHSIIGGLGSAIAEYVAESSFRKIKFKRIGIPNVFGTSARNIEDLYKHFELDENSLAKRFEEFIST